MRCFCLPAELDAQDGVFGQQMCLAAAKRLAQMKDRLAGAPAQPRQPLGDQRAHPFGDVGAGKEGRAVAFGGDQFVKLFDLVADMNVERVLLQRAGIFDGDEHGWFPLGWLDRPCIAHAWLAPRNGRSISQELLLLDFFGSIALSWRHFDARGNNFAGADEAEG